MKGKHMNPERAAAVIFGGKHLTLRESDHLRSCEHCHQWVIAFTELARLSNVEIKTRIPELKKADLAQGHGEARPAR